MLEAFANRFPLITMITKSRMTTAQNSVLRQRNSQEEEAKIDL